MRLIPSSLLAFAVLIVSLLSSCSGTGGWRKGKVLVTPSLSGLWVYEELTSDQLTDFREQLCGEVQRLEGLDVLEPKDVNLVNSLAELGSFTREDLDSLKLVEGGSLDRIRSVLNDLAAVLDAEVMSASKGKLTLRPEAVDDNIAWGIRYVIDVNGVRHCILTSSVFLTETEEGENRRTRWGIEYPKMQKEQVVATYDINWTLSAGSLGIDCKTNL